MQKRTFFVRAVWDDEAQVFYTESDIIGLHAEAADLQSLEAVVTEVAGDLIVANHLSEAELASMPMKSLIPTIFWHHPILPAAA